MSDRQYITPKASADMCYICAYCYCTADEADAVTYWLMEAVEEEIQWANDPIEVQEYQCPECGEWHHYWYFPPPREFTEKTT